MRERRWKNQPSATGWQVHADVSCARSSRAQQLALFVIGHLLPSLVPVNVLLREAAGLSASCCVSKARRATGNAARITALGIMASHQNLEAVPAQE